MGSLHPGEGQAGAGTAPICTSSRNMSACEKRSITPSRSKCRIAISRHAGWPRTCLSIYETRDGGASWSPRGDGLPAKHAYLTVLRQAFSRAGEGPGLELYFAVTSGDVFGSAAARAPWSTVATRLPPVLLVVAV
ncbi:MAG: hypothetical protein ACYDHH_31030 [Solirubrobacteraceae bacterium]